MSMTFCWICDDTIDSDFELEVLPNSSGDDMNVCNKCYEKGTEAKRKSDEANDCIGRSLNWLGI